MAVRLLVCRLGTRKISSEREEPVNQGNPLMRSAALSTRPSASVNFGTHVNDGTS